MVDPPEFIDFPFAISSLGRSAITGDDEHVKDLIRLVLFTAPGERVNRPEFGCGLRQLLFAPNSEALSAATEQLVHGSLIRWLDPVISVQRVTVEAEESSLSVTVVYSRRGVDEQRQVTFDQSTI